MGQAFGEIGTLLRAYPVATVSTMLFYALAAAMVHPAWRRAAARLLAHPISPKGHYLTGFDTLRGMAALYVALGHFWWFSYPLFAKTQWAVPSLAYNSKAVSLFVVLSGFLIYRSALAIDGLAALRHYVRRRFFRIYPMYLLSVLLCLAWGQAVPSQPGIGSASYFVSELMMFRAIGFPLFANPVTWSLYVEVAFYAFLPIFVIFFGREKILLPSAVALAALIVADQGPIRELYLWKYFFFGIIASEVSQRHRALLNGKVPLAVLAVGAAVLAMDLQGPAYDWAFHAGLVRKNPAEMTVGLGLGFALVCAALPHVPSAGRALDVFPLRFVGVVSYSLFIIHPFYILANFPELAFGAAGMPPMYEHFKALPMLPAWYMPLLFAPGILLWSAVAFLLVERPFLVFASRTRKTVPGSAERSFVPT